MIKRIFFITTLARLSSFDSTACRYDFNPCILISLTFTINSVSFYLVKRRRYDAMIVVIRFVYVVVT